MIKVIIEDPSIKNWILYVIGKYSRKVRRWYYKKNESFLWGIKKFVQDNRPAIMEGQARIILELQEVIKHLEFVIFDAETQQKTLREEVACLKEKLHQDSQST